MGKITPADMKAIELKAPGACQADAVELSGMVEHGLVFGAFDRVERKILWNEVLRASCDCLIPSLFGFFEDLNYLKVVSDCDKRLFKPPTDRTLSDMMKNRFVGHKTKYSTIQESETSFRDREAGEKDQFDLLHRQIWIAAIRNYLSMPAEPEKKNPVAIPNHQEVDEVVLFEFARLAYRSRLDTDQIRELMVRSADRDIARSALLKARKPNRYHYDEAVLEENVTKIVSLFSTAQLATVQQLSAALEA
jgi:hypothetical protein